MPFLRSDEQVSIKLITYSLQQEVKLEEICWVCLCSSIWCNHLRPLSQNLHLFVGLRVQADLINLVAQFICFRNTNYLLKDLSLILFGVTSWEFLLEVCLAAMCLSYIYFLASFIIQGPIVATPSWTNHKFQGCWNRKCQLILHELRERGREASSVCWLSEIWKKKMHFVSCCYFRFLPSC